MKKVIFIGGSSYSGSTLLDMILSNSEECFSCGEINALFYPYRKHHINPVCACGNKECNIWEIIKSRGISELYQTIFELFPNVNILVDSSKDPLWIYDRTIALQSKDIAVENVLIWKSPSDFFNSRIKRNRQYGMVKAWVNYHKLYFGLINNWCSLKYKDLANSPESLEALCNAMQMPYTQDRIRYWEKKHHTLFGNTSAKIHLYDKSSIEYSKCSDELDTSIAENNRNKENREHQIITYEEPKYGEGYPKTLRSDEINKIISILMSTDVANRTNDINHKKLKGEIESVMASDIFKRYHKVKRALRSLFFKSRKYLKLIPQDIAD